MDSFVKAVNRGDLDAEVAGAKKSFEDNQKKEGVFNGWALAQTTLG
jgi:hypothetical protein